MDKKNGVFKMFSSSGDKEAEALVDFVDLKLKDNNEMNLKILATKEDIHTLRSELQKQIGDNKAEMIKWMFIFWIGQVVATFGFILLFLKK